MAQTVNVNFRMDAELLKSMEQVCADLGLSMTTAFTIFAKKVSREKRINTLIKDIQRSIFEGIGKPEQLKDNLSGL